MFLKDILGARNASFFSEPANVFERVEDQFILSIQDLTEFGEEYEKDEECWTTKVKVILKTILDRTNTIHSGRVRYVQSNLTNCLISGRNSDSKIIIIMYW